jgi:hypothetical protein
MNLTTMHLLQNLFNKINVSTRVLELPAKIINASSLIKFNNHSLFDLPHQEIGTYQVLIIVLLVVILIIQLVVFTPFLSYFVNRIAKRGRRNRHDLFDDNFVPEDNCRTVLNRNLAFNLGLSTVQNNFELINLTDNASQIGSRFFNLPRFDSSTQPASSSPTQPASSSSTQPASSSSTQPASSSSTQPASSSSTQSASALSTVASAFSIQGQDEKATTTQDDNLAKNNTTKTGKNGEACRHSQRLANGNSNV